MSASRRLFHNGGRTCSSSRFLHTRARICWSTCRPLHNGTRTCLPSRRSLHTRALGFARYLFCPQNLRDLIQLENYNINNENKKNIKSFGFREFLKEKS
ncbi:hypothetical protein Bca4012_066031 [Brassica carinata]